MYLDRQNMLSQAQALASAAGTYYSTDVIDLGMPNQGEGEPLEVLAQVVETFTSGGAGTLQFQLVTDSAVGFGASPVTLFDSGALALATLVAGYQASIRVLPNNCKRYIRMTYIIGTAAMTAGKVTAGLVRHLQTNK